MTYELIFMRRRNSQIIDIFHTQDSIEFNKIKKHIITTHGLVRVRSGRAHGERYSQTNNGSNCDYVMVSRAVDIHRTKRILEIADKCFKEIDNEEAVS